MKERIALVVQRYGQEVNGGAELLCRQVAERLAPLYDAEVLTTCAIDHVTWRNEYPSGVSTLNGVSIRRFPVDFERNPHVFHRLSLLAYDSGRIKGPRRIFQKFIEERWMRSQGPYSTPLFRYLRQPIVEKIHIQKTHALLFIMKVQFFCICKFSDYSRLYIFFMESIQNFFCFCFN